MGSAVLHRWFGYFAVGLGLVFEAAGILALFTVAGLILAIVLPRAVDRWRRRRHLAVGRKAREAAPAHAAVR